MIGHMLNHRDELYSTLIEEMIEGTYSRGRPGTRYISHIMKNMRKLKDMANNRKTRVVNTFFIHQSLDGKINYYIIWVCYEILTVKIQIGQNQDMLKSRHFESLMHGFDSSPII